MKHLLNFFLLLPLTCFSQENTGTLVIRKQQNNGEAFRQLVEPNEFDEPLFTIVEDMPEFPGGQKGMMNYLANNINYPEDAKRSGKSGTVYVQFVIDKKGKVGNAKVLRGVSATLNNEALRVINNMPDWKAGKQRGKRVDVVYTIPINFILN